jgi:hypothetical protein
LAALDRWERKHHPVTVLFSLSRAGLLLYQGKLTGGCVTRSGQATGR